MPYHPVSRETAAEAIDEIQKTERLIAVVAAGDGAFDVFTEVVDGPGEFVLHNFPAPRPIIGDASGAEAAFRETRRAGGPVKKPTRVLTGEAGPEAVVPLKKDGAK